VWPTVMVPCPPGTDPDEWAGRWLIDMLEAQTILRKKQQQQQRRR